MDAWFSAWTELWIQNVSGLLLVLGPQWFQTLKREGNAGPIEASCSGAWELVPLGYPDRAPTETPRLVSRWNGDLGEESQSPRLRNAGSKANP